MTSPGAYMNVNGENLHKVVQDAKLAANVVLHFKDEMIKGLEEDIRDLGSKIEHIFQRLNVCESIVNTGGNVSLISL